MSPHPAQGCLVINRSRIRPGSYTATKPPSTNSSTPATKLLSIDDSIVKSLDRKIIELLHGLQVRIQVNVILKHVRLSRASRQDASKGDAGTGYLSPLRNDKRHLSAKQLDAGYIGQQKSIFHY
jgi:hypothetical protein